MKLSSLWIAVVTGFIATLLWDTFLLLPLKLLIVLVHEIWHGLFALLAGGELEKIQINGQEAGETLVSGLDSFWGFFATVSAGYIGSALVGALMLRGGLAGKWNRGTLVLFAIGLAMMSHAFTDRGSLASYVGIGWSFAILLCILPGERPAGVLLIVLGTLFVWYSFFDLFDFTGNVLSTDAGILATYLQKVYNPAAEHPPVTLAHFISAAWSLLIVGIIYLALRPVLPRAARSPAPLPVETEPALEIGFPGALTPEIAAWLMERGLGPDGQPLVSPALLAGRPDNSSATGLADADPGF